MVSNQTEAARIEAGTLVDPDECRRNGAFTQERIDIIVAEERGR
jgi:hypothetical protein